MGSSRCEARSPASRSRHVPETTPQAMAQAIDQAVTAFHAWRELPAPRRGELVRLLAEELRREKEALGALVTLEAGKIVQEGLGEVQEMIDICDFAVGLSRQLYGLTIASERPGHRMMRDLAPAGSGGRHHRLQLPGRRLELERGAGAGLRRPRDLEAVLADAADGARLPGAPASGRPSACGGVPEGLMQVVVGSAGRALVDDRRVPLVSATGSTAMGQAMAPQGGRPAGPLAARAGRQQRHDRHPQRRSRPGRAGDPVRGRRHLRPALHQRCAG